MDFHHGFSEEQSMEKSRGNLWKSMVKSKKKINKCGFDGIVLMI
jgi:hypothetical protein